MATTEDYIEFVIDCLHGDYSKRYKKMFGEYMVYINDKPVLLVCDNTVYVKILPELESLMKGADTGYPYDGAKMHYILDIENEELVSEVIAILEKITPLPKKRK